MTQEVGVNEGPTLLYVKGITNTCLEQYSTTFHMQEGEKVGIHSVFVYAVVTWSLHTIQSHHLVPSVVCGVILY